MKGRDVVELVVLAALWGASFIFMRVAVPEFGPVALIAVRVGIAAVFLLIILHLRRQTALLGRHAAPLIALGVLNSAMPFCLLAYATLHVTAGFASILNASTPLWGAMVAYLWLRDRLRAAQVVGLAIGFFGVIVLVWGKAHLRGDGASLAVFAGLAAALSYGIAASFAKRHLSGVAPLAVATGSQIGASLVAVPAALFWWPSQPISSLAWASVIVLGVASTGIAYILFFRLLANIGPARAITVTFLVPVFAIVWGWAFLAESISLQMIVGGLIVLCGTALSTGLVASRAT
ncbi:MAG: DMT family transporter [Zoogloeaceae bacterium]|nr:DMT family transporter [Zoogloeaceae bacterium]